MGGVLRKVTEVEELLGILQGIGIRKNGLPLHLRDWLNSLGLYVKLRYAGGWARLEAGGKFRSCFDALCRDYNFDAMLGKASAWEIRRFDRETWGNRFAHLVEPTSQIAIFVSDNEDMTRPSGSEFGEHGVATLMQVVQHFKSTGEWLGLPSGRRCATCGQSVSIGEWQGESCPHCGGNLRRESGA